MADPIELKLDVPSHIGMVVADMDAAQESLSRDLGISWVTSHDAVVPVTTAHGRADVRLYCCWSTRGPSYIELIQGMPGTIWAPDGPMCLHHIGYWVRDLATASAQLIAAGRPREATIIDARGDPTVFAYHVGAARIELTDGARRTTLMNLLDAAR